MPFQRLFNLANFFKNVTIKIVKVESFDPKMSVRAFKASLSKTQGWIPGQVF